MNPAADNRFQQVAQWLANAERAVAFTGAGISTESGIPDFRSPGGVWSQFQPVYFQEFLASPEARYESWRQKSLIEPEFSRAAPNVGHALLSRWERAGRLRGLITQNIDGLHQLAGSRRVLELHGTAREVACLDCSFRAPIVPWIERFRQTNQVPPCPSCGGRMKSATVSFGQALPEEVLREAVAWSKEADLFLALGSSLVVEPAASLPRMARRAGARLVIINRDPTEQDRLADVAFHAPLGTTLAAIDSDLERIV